MSQIYYEPEENTSGASLAAAREALNMSVSDVARHLKLSSAQVEALEAGAYDRLPGRVFVRGFLRNYAKLLGIDPQPLLRTIDHEMPQPSSVAEPPASAEVVMPREKAGRWSTYLAIGAATIVGALAVYEFGFNDPPGSHSQAEATSAGNTGAGASEPAAAALAFPPGATAPEPPAESSVQLVPDTLPNALAAGTSLPSSAGLVKPAPSEITTPTTDPAAPLGAGQRSLHFRFEQDSWVQVRDRDDKIIFSKLNATGTEERVIGMPPFKLVVGNARGVRLDYGETQIDLAPLTSAAVARLTLP